MSKILQYSKNGRHFAKHAAFLAFWIAKNLDQAIIFNLLKSETYTSLAANPSRIENQIPNDFKHWIVIDEVQKIPQLLDEATVSLNKKTTNFY